jgi:RND family efflux transporter MFP subunit
VVDEGAVLAKLDPRDIRSSLDSAKAQFDNAEAEYQRAERLAAGNAISTRDLEQRKSQRYTAKAQLDSATKALSDAVLVAPFAGVVAKVHVEEFQNVQPQETIVTLIGTGDREVAIDVPASVVAKSRTAGESSAFVVLDVAPSVRIPAQFKEATLEADSASQTYEVRFAFQPPEDLIILPGMSATVIVETATPEAEGATAGAGVSVPLAAVQSEGDRNYVWVIDPEAMTASKRWVTIQAGVGENVIATDGVTAGETIAGSGAAHLAEGMKVRPWTD